MTPASDSSARSSVIVVGPPAHLVGGMASVVEQNLSVDLGSRYRAEPFPTTCSTDDAESLCGRVLRHVRHLKSLADVIRRLRPAIVHIHTCSGFSFYRSTADMLLARLLACRTVLHIHGAAFDRFYAEGGALRRRFIDRSLSRADCIIALSEMWRSELLKMAPHGQVVVIENAIAGPGNLPRRKHEGPCRFLLLARMDDWKGIDDLLDAAARMREAGSELELALAGPEGTAGDAAVLRQKICERGLDGQVRYAGSVRGQEKSKLLHWADVFVQASHNEGMPIALLEALAHGLPIIATRVGAIPEVITDGREGILVPPHHPDRLCEAMCTLAADRARRERMGNAAKQLAATRFSLERFRDDLISMYDHVRDGKARYRKADDRAPGEDSSRLPLPTGTT